MQTAHQIVASFIAAKAIDITDFNQWFKDGGYSQDEANVHDSRYLHLLETFVEERDDGHVAQPGTPAKQTEYETAEDFIALKAVDTTDFIQWFRDGGGSHDKANTHDSRCLNMLKIYVAERDGERPATLPRVLNKHIHGIPAGAVYIGRGSPWGNPFIIGRDGDRKDVVAKYDAWIDTQPHLLARLPDLRHRQLVCFCAPSLCHGNPLRRRANAPVCEAI